MNRKRGPGCISLLLLFLQCRSWVAEEEAMRSVSRACAPRLQPMWAHSQPLLSVPGAQHWHSFAPFSSWDSTEGYPHPIKDPGSVESLKVETCPQLRFSSVTRLLPSLAFAQLSKVPTPSLLHKLCVPPLTLIYGNFSHWGPWWKPCCLIKWMFSGPFILEFSTIFNASIIFSWKFSSLAPVEITY